MLNNYGTRKRKLKEGEIDMITASFVMVEVPGEISAIKVDKILYATLDKLRPLVDLFYHHYSLTNMETAFHLWRQDPSWEAARVDKHV